MDCRQRGLYPMAASTMKRSCRGGMIPRKQKRPDPVARNRGVCKINPGSDLHSHAVASAVSSAQRGLTSVFGMGTGGTPAEWPPGNLRSHEGRVSKKNFEPSSIDLNN